MFEDALEYLFVACSNTNPQFHVIPRAQKAMYDGQPRKEAKFIVIEEVSTLGRCK
jgi:hypothetical protein